MMVGIFSANMPNLIGRPDPVAQVFFPFLDEIESIPFQPDKTGSVLF